ncbi:hypothetical protein [Halococcoides cellulosivorans]|uniref:hypothetical protein n=1 Tax=Halococcoides cellulosivorans TaxID=1679096 RepID=UPI00131F1662|nr:hypothetical protein [Halococcoides cellulosivorans]
MVQGGGQVLLDDIEDADPVFGWRGGQPYDSDRPTLILHCADSDDEIQSFSFLQHALRDTFTELQGGEPTVEQVDFVANEVQIPTVSGRIVTLDLTDDEWTASEENGSPTIKRGGVDVVPALRDHGDTLYSGNLGYLVVNVPQEWESTYRRRNFVENLIADLADAAPPQDNDNTTGAFETLRSAPVTVARPRVTDADRFAERVAQYFGFTNAPAYETISQFDASFTAALRADRWAKVALTERQSYGEESSRHYNWKALVAEGLARTLWNAARDGDQPFETFVRESLINDGPLATEHVLSSGVEDDDSVIADVFLDEDRRLPTDQLDGFLDRQEHEAPLAIEFETGFSEAAFGYRKLVESVEKYQESQSVETLFVVVPPRLLYRGERQARHLDRLVQNQEDIFETLRVRLCVPCLSESRCIGLQTASDLITRLYDDV